MTLMMDWIRANGIKPVTPRGKRIDMSLFPIPRERAVTVITSLPVFDITNVADYFFKTADDFHDPRNYPNIIPPFSEYWMEFTYPDVIVNGDGSMRSVKAQKILKIGIYARAEQTDDGWTTSLFPFLTWIGPRYNLGPLCEIRFTADQDGVPNQDAIIITMDDGDDDDLAAMHNTKHSFVGPVCLALSFMHCKNVVVTEQDGVYTNRQERREAQRRNDPPLVKHHTLHIEPMKTIIKRESGGDPVTMTKALHIVRGHIAEYGDAFGKGKLFGKYEGRFFIPAHVRGSAEQGVIDKRYVVHPPKDDAA